MQSQYLLSRMLKTSCMILLLFAGVSLSAQTAKADSCKAEQKEQCTQVKPEKEPVLATSKQVSKKGKKEKKSAGRMEDGFLFKRQSISQL